MNTTRVFIVVTVEMQCVAVKKKTPQCQHLDKNTNFFF